MMMILIFPCNDLSIRGTHHRDFVYLQKMVADAQLSGSNEEPEAGFDALMQSIVCEVS